MSKFWDDMQNAFIADSSLDLHLQGKTLGGKQATTIRELTEAGRLANALETPSEAGTRVRFESNIGSVLTYDDVPDPNAEGTVILVKTAMGKMTSMDDRVFVLWDDGKFRPIMAEHLRPASTITRRAKNFRIVVSNLGDISNLFTAATASDELIHKSTKDLWSFKKQGEDFVIERLFNDTGSPLKV